MPPKGHAILSASSSDRWLHCPPSARLCETYEDTTRCGSNGFEVCLGGDCELETMIRALKFITKVLEDESKEVYD